MTSYGLLVLMAIYSTNIIMLLSCATLYLSGNGGCLAAISGLLSCLTSHANGSMFDTQCR